MRALAICLVVVGVWASCGGDKPPIDPPDEVEAVELTLEADGKERGTGMSDPAGRVAFYSPVHQALFSLDLVDAKDAKAANLQVHIEASADGFTYYAEDPSGTYMPMLVSAPLPTALDQTLEVKGADQLIAPDPAKVASLRPGIPGQKKPFIVGLLVSISIRSVLVSIGEAAILMVLTNIVTDTCTFFAPLHEDTCGTIGAVVGFMATVATGGVKLALGKGFSWARAAVQATWEATWSKLVEEACGAAGKVLVGWIQPPPDGEKAVQTRYRQVAYKYRSLMEKLDTMPPADPAAKTKFKADLVAAGKAIAGIAPKVRNHYYEVYNTDTDDFLTEASFMVTAETVKNLVEVRPLIFESLTLGYGYDELLVITDKGVSYSRYEFAFGQLETSVGDPVETPWGAETGFDCLMAIAQEAKITWDDNGTMREAEVNIETALGHMVDMLSLYLDDVSTEFYGGPVDPPACLPDIWEVNDTWQAGLAMPFAGSLGSGIVRVEDVNLCDGVNAGDEDWFTMDAAPINFGVEARVRAPETGTPVGQNEHICLQMYWYSQITELSGDVPYLLPGSACGTVASEFSTDMVNVAQSTGEAYRYVMVRVFPDPAYPTPATQVDYIITFTH